MYVFPQNGEEKTRIERQPGVPIWSLSWNPLRYVLVFMRDLIIISSDHIATFLGMKLRMFFVLLNGMELFHFIVLEENLSEEKDR